MAQYQSNHLTSQLKVHDKLMRYETKLNEMHSILATLSNNSLTSQVEDLKKIPKEYKANAQ